MRRIIGLVLVLCLFCMPLAVEAVGGKHAKYVGGTVTALTENAEGAFTLGQAGAEFSPAKSQKFTILYAKVDSLEYGQKAGRRLGLALAVSPLFLLSHKRKHFLTINFADEAGKMQGAVFELGKGITRETLAGLEAKTGKKVDYESEEARKYAQGK
jgi:hypothetical protein